MAVETTVKQMALLRNQEFMERCQATMVKVAKEVLEEAATSAYNQQRVMYAQNVLRGPQMAVQQGGTTIVMGASVIAGTVYDEQTKTSSCNITDDNLTPQIQSLWNVLAGIHTPD